MATEIQIIRSRNLIAKTAKRLNLNRNPEFNAELRPVSRLAIFQEKVRSYLAKQVPTIFSNTADEEQLSQTEKNIKERDKIIDAILGNLEADSIGLSRVIEIKFESENPHPRC